jgi:hypothetical protein
VRRRNYASPLPSVFLLGLFFTADPSLASLIYINGTALQPVFEGGVALESTQGLAALAPMHEKLAWRQ